MNENKEIEKIADILCESKNHNCSGGEDCKCLKQASDLYNAGCRIVKENTLSRREWYQIGYKDARKETAREILSLYRLSDTFSSFQEKVIKQYGVEVE